jgi:hypothetical protein
MMKKNKIIGFAGKMRSGKTQSALCLAEEYGYVKLSAADALKGLCAKLMGIDVEELNRIKNTVYEKWTEPYFEVGTNEWVETIAKNCNIEQSLIGKEFHHESSCMRVRQILQFVGTDIIRKYNKNWHVEQLKKKIVECIGNNQKVVIDDIRFDNERKMVEELGGEVYYIIRDNFKINSEHASENSLCENEFDKKYIIHNDGSIEDLNQKIRELFL